MRTLLLVAHGSRMTSSNETVAALTEKLRPRLTQYGFGLITHAFLELTEPSIPDGVAQLVTDGATQVVVLPYFLAPGTHVVDDVPELVNEAKEKYPEVSFTVMSHLGGVDGMVDLILATASEAE
jgi:sirohydrochlorin ferrochelatase